MNKGQLIEKIAQGITENLNEKRSNKAIVGIVLNSYIDTVHEVLASGDNIQIIGYGTMAVDHRKATTGRNPRTGEVIEIEAKNVVKFKPGKSLKESVNN